MKKSNVWSIADTIGVPFSERSETQSTPATNKIPRNLEQSSSGLRAENTNLNLSESTSPCHDATPGVDIAGEVGSMMDKTTKTNDSRAKKRRTPSLVVSDDSDGPRKPKRIRKSAKKKDISENTGHSLPPDWIPRSKEMMPVRSVPPGEKVTLTITSDDRDVNPVKANCTQYYPRSISKGIGFVPIEPTTESSTSSLLTSTVSESLDVLASISASLRTNDLPRSTQELTGTTACSVIQSFSGKNRHPPIENRQHSEHSPTHFGRDQQPIVEDRQRTDDYRKSTDAIRQGYENIQMSNARDQAPEFGVGAGPSTNVNEKQTTSVGKQLAGGCDRSTASEGSQTAVGGSAFVDLLIQDKTRPIQKPVEPGIVIVDTSGKDKTLDAVDKQKKRRRDRPKKDKKLKNKAVEATTPTTDEGLPNTALNMSLLFLIASDKKNKANNVFPVTEQLVPTIPDLGDKSKQNVFPIDVGLNDIRPCAVRNTIVESEGNVDVSKVSEYQRAADFSNQDSSKPMDRTCAVLSQEVRPFSVDENLLRSTELLASKEKQKKKEIDGASKARKKEKKSKHDGSKAKKTSEKKSLEKKLKDNQINRKENDGAVKPVSKVKQDQEFAKAGETDEKQVHEGWSHDKLGGGNEYNARGRLSAGIYADEISPSVSDEGTVMIEISQPENNIEIVPSEGERSEGAGAEISGEKATETIPVQLLGDTVEDPGVSQKLQDSKLEYDRNVNDKVQTTVENSSEIREKFASVVSPKKQKNDITKSHGKKPSSEKNRRKSAKDEKSTKNVKKADRKSEKNNLKTLDKDEKKDSVSSQEGAVQVNGILISAVAVNSQQEGSVEEQGKQKTIKQQLGIADAILKGLEKRQDDIVFVNDQSVKNVVNADDENDDVFSERLLDRKRKRCKSPRENNSVLAENNGKDFEFYVISSFKTVRDKLFLCTFSTCVFNVEICFHVRR